MLNFNVATTYAFCQLCVPLMREAGGGNIINISSVAARYAQRHFSAYGTAKAALSHLTRLLAQDFAPQIRVNAVAPGPTLTEALNGVMPTTMRQVMETNTPLKCLGTPQDIAAAALYLASPASAWVTGKMHRCRWRCRLVGLARLNRHLCACTGLLSGQAFFPAIWSPHHGCPFDHRAR